MTGIATTIRVAYLRKELADALDEIERLRALITAWADAYKGANVAIGGFDDDIEAYTDACGALRKAVGR